MTKDWIDALAAVWERRLLGLNHPEVLEAKRQAALIAEEEMFRAAGPLPVIAPEMLEVGK